ncbi:SGNH/GDSL hydrolase family protein [Aurantiacibacter marinus]|uniref:SGNH/GDSL hydrolase family protein n=1 Tax=Aurantiacibacter marinus TaxID=874156 RepID=UPI0012DFF1FC|nr:SGNH/GDSL hydrolase family protein [Aurantiacibacter marinus]
MVAALVLVIGELTARYVIGLGTPPLTIVDEVTEYRFAPNQDVTRFHNRQLYNEFSMRSPPLDQVSADRRVIVLGDSVINGGGLTDHSDLATTIASNDAIFFGNASAGSWGPANLAGWIERFGYAGADSAVLVLNSKDLNDIPSFDPLDSLDYPVEKPVSAFGELITRYLLPEFGWRSEAEPRRQARARSGAGEIEIARLMDRFREDGVPLCIVHNPMRRELLAEILPAGVRLQELFKERGVPVISARDVYRTQNESGADLYRDDIHLNAEGQRALAPLLIDCAAAAQVPSPPPNQTR